MFDRYRARTRHLGLDDDGKLWLLRPPEEDDQLLGFVAITEVPDDLLYEAGWLLEEWLDAPDPADLRAEARATYYGGLLG